jgi:predicted DNA-binding protein (MmcQ/YjbR family)
MLGSMSRETVNAICAGLPGAETSDPWGGGHDAWKVGGRMFAVVGAVQPGVSVKTASVEEAEMLIAAGVGTRARYMHASWILLPEDCEAGELEHRLRRAYRIIRGGLPKKVQAGLAPLEDG